DVARRGVLRLEPADLFHGIHDRQQCALEQHLPSEEHPVECPWGQGPVGHVVMMAETAVGGLVQSCRYGRRRPAPDGVTPGSRPIANTSQGAPYGGPSQPYAPWVSAAARSRSGLESSVWVVILSLLIPLAG